VNGFEESFAVKKKKKKKKKKKSRDDGPPETKKRILNSSAMAQQKFLEKEREKADGAPPFRRCRRSRPGRG